MYLGGKVTYLKAKLVPSSRTPCSICFETCQILDPQRKYFFGIFSSQNHQTFQPGQKKQKKSWADTTSLRSLLTNVDVKTVTEELKENLLVKDQQKIANQRKIFSNWELLTRFLIFHLKSATSPSLFLLFKERLWQKLV